MQVQLTPRQARFVDEYANSRNGAAAAVQSGYAVGSARVTASRLLTNANVRAALAAREAEFQRRLNAARDRIVAELEHAVSVAEAAGDAAAMIRGWQAIAEICGYYNRS